MWITILLLSFPAVAAALIFGFKRLRQPLGFIEPDKKGIFLACYTTGPLHLTSFGDWFSWGFAEWTNLAVVGIAKRNFAEGLGLRFEDLDAFLASRQKLMRQDLIRHSRLGPQWARLTVSCINTTFLGKFLALGWTFQGLTVPKSMEEKDVLVWNYENFGFHIIVLGRTIPCKTHALVELIETWRQSANSNSSSTMLA